MAAQKQQPAQSEDDNDDQQNPYSDEEVGSERSKSAEKALELEKKAKDYTDAAAAAGNAQERQALLNKAINAQIEAESFGKWAKFLNSGAFQGFVRGSIPAFTIGALTGTLVGGVVALVTGGLGAGIGFFTGPIVNLGDVAGNMIGSLTSKFLPDWEASEEQKKTLENMLGAVHDQDAPTAEELQEMKESQDPVHSAQGKDIKLGGGWGKQSYTDYATSWVPSFGGKKKKGGGGGQGAKQGGAPQQAQNAKQRIQKGDVSESMKTLSKEQQAMELHKDTTARNLAARMNMNERKAQEDADAQDNTPSSRANGTGRGPQKTGKTTTQKSNSSTAPSQPKKSAPSKAPNGSAKGPGNPSTSNKGSSQSQGTAKPATPSKRPAESAARTGNDQQGEASSKNPATRSAAQPKPTPSDETKPKSTAASKTTSQSKSGSQQAGKPQRSDPASKPSSKSEPVSPASRTRDAQKKPQKLQVRSKQAAVK